MNASTEWTPEQLRSALDSGQPVTVLDIRAARDREWWIPGSVHADVFDALKAGDAAPLESAMRDLPKAAPVVAVCNAGQTSGLALPHLQRLGYSAFSLRDGMRGWSEAWNTAAVQLPPGTPQVLQVRRTGKGCLSYVVLSGREALVVDPSVGAEVYVELARAAGARVVAVAETHVHADHVSRGGTLCSLTGARLYLPPQQRVVTPFTPATDGMEIPFGAARVRVLSTPGHTPESACYLLEGAAVFTGDTLFVQGVGRPDLKAEGREAEGRARLLHDSLTRRIFPLDPRILVLPGHASEPLAFDGVPHAATLAEARASAGVDALDEDRFVAHLLRHLPPTPPNHFEIIRINEGRVAAPADLRTLEAGANRCAIRG